MLPHARLRLRRHSILLLQIAHGAANCLLHARRRDRLELKDRASGQNGVIDVEIWILRRGCDQGDLSVFDVFQQRLLLLFIEVLDLVEIEQNAVRSQKRVQLGIDLLDISGGGRRRVELAELTLRLRGDQIGDRCFPGAGRAIKDHVRHIAGKNDPAQKAVFSKYMLLSADLVQRGRPEYVCQRLIHASASFVFPNAAPLLRTARRFLLPLYEILF